MIRGTSTADGDGGGSPSGHEQALSALLQKQLTHVIGPGTAKAAKLGGSDGDGETRSISSSVFRRDHVDETGRRERGGAAHSDSVMLSEEVARRNARLDTQYRLRLLPAALWGDRARQFDSADDHDSGGDDKGATQTAAQEQRQTFLTAVHGSGSAGTATVGPTTQKKIDARTKANVDSRGATGGARGGKKRAIAAVPESPLVFPESTRGVPASAGLPAGATRSQAASLKRPAVDSSVPLRWQSRVIAMSSLRDTFAAGAETRGSPSMGRRMARTRCRAYQRNKKRRSETDHAFRSSLSLHPRTVYMIPGMLRWRHGEGLDS